MSSYDIERYKAIAERVWNRERFTPSASEANDKGR
jgi:hypothetical protein